MAKEIVQVEPMDKSKNNSEVAEKMSGERTVILGADALKCYWNDEAFTEESLICDSGVAYKCHMGVWLKQSDGC
jgi:hypothetical protein